MKKAYRPIKNVLFIISFFLISQSLQAQEKLVGVVEEKVNEGDKQLVTNWFSYGFAISNGGMLGIPIRVYSPNRKTSIELGTYLQPDYSDRYDIEDVSVMIMGGPIFFGKQKFHKAKKNAKGKLVSSDRISQSGIGVKVGMSTSLATEYLAAVCWSYEYFLQHNPNNSFNLELGLGGIHQNESNPNHFTTEALRATVFFKVTFNIYGGQSYIVDKPAYILLY